MMDGDGHNAKAFAWNDDGGRNGSMPVDTFDPAAVLRAIEDEEDEETPEAIVPVPGEPQDDLSAALKVAMAFEAQFRVEAGADEAYPRAEGHVDEVLDDDDYEDDIAASDDHDDAEDWDDRHADEEDEASAQDDEGLSFEDADPEADLGHDGEPDGMEPTARAFPTMDDLDMPDRKPRIALMGEFSAGKSTLSNLLMGAAPLPTKVTATQLPPVWISWGEGAPYREDLDGDTHAIDIARLAEIDPAETRMIRIFGKSSILEQCDIIDMPGISDPNMASDVWERVIGKADGVIWCTHATQAWRQSEASVWESLDPQLFDRSLLLVTRFDKLHSESDRIRVLRRVERETEGLFAACLPISLTDALAAGDDEHLLERSGSTMFMERLQDMIARIAHDLGSGLRVRQGQERTRETLGQDGMIPRREVDASARDVTPSRILPRRVRQVSEDPRERPEPERRDPGL